MAASVTSAAVATTSAAITLTTPPQFKIVGIILALLSGLLIGSSFVFKKKGLLSSQAGGPAGEGVAYLKSPMWWTGMTMMILGELCNFGSYAFIPAIIVTPLGALSVVICAILSSIFLNESLTFFGWIGCFLCIVGSVIIALNGPKESTASTIVEFQHLFLSLGFIVFGSLVILTALVIIFFFAPKYGKQSMLWYIMICSLFGGLSVSCTQGLGSSIVTSIRGQSQFKHWFIYFLMIFVVATLITEIYYLNVALALFNTAMVTPTYYVIFTFFTLVTSIVLYKGLHASLIQIITICMGFLVICAGITILQMSKVDPTLLSNLDRKSTLLLQVARQKTEQNEKTELSGMEDPGPDALRGSFGAFGSIIRARSISRLSMSTDGSVRQRRRFDEESRGRPDGLSTHGLANLPRHQLYDAPMPGSTQDDLTETISMQPQQSTPSNPPGPSSSPRPHPPTIRFEQGDIAHYYPSPGKSGTARHEPRERVGSTLIPSIAKQTGAAEEYAVPVTPQPSPERPRQPPQVYRQTPDLFHEINQSTTALFSPSPSLPESEEDLHSQTSPEEVTHGHPLLTPRRGTSRGRNYPGGNSSSEEEQEARTGLVRDREEPSSPSHRGGIRLVSSKSTPPRRV